MPILRQLQLHYINVNSVQFVLIARDCGLGMGPDPAQPKHTFDKQ